MTRSFLAKIKNKKFPIIVEKDDKFYIVECPLFSGCFTQGKTMDEALRNIKEVIEMCLEEKENREILAHYHPKELSLHSISL